MPYYYTHFFLNLSQLQQLSFVLISIQIHKSYKTNCHLQNQFRKTHIFCLL